MTYHLGTKSLEKLKYGHLDLRQIIMTGIITAPFDYTIISIYRDKEEQNALYHANPQRSKVLYPNSMHNKKPSLAADLAPYPIDWEDEERFRILACHIKIVAYKLNIPIIWGPDLGGWMKCDLGHYQLKKV